MKKQSMLKGTMVLGAAGILAKFLGIFFRWPLQMLIGDEGVGYYQMSYPLYMFFVAVASGVPVAISKMVSERCAVGDREGTIVILRKSLLLMLYMGGGFSLLLIFFSSNLISFLKWDNKAYYSMMGIAIAPLFISIMSAFRGFFQGMQNMNSTAISQVVEQIGRVVVGVFLAFLLLPYGKEFSAGGAAFGAAAGGIFGGAYLYFRYRSYRKDFVFHRQKGSSQVLSRLLYIAIPISLGATVGSVMSLIDSILVPQKLLQAGFNSTQATVLFARLTGKAFVLINVPLTLSMALCASIVPIITEYYVLGKNSELRGKVQTALKLSFLIALPSAAGLFLLASPILSLIFPGQSSGGTILRYSSLTLPLIVITQISTAILQGVGKYIGPVINLAIGCTIKIVMTLLLVPIPSLHIYGAIIASFCGYLTSTILNMLMLNKRLKHPFNYFEAMIKPAAATLIMMVVVVIIYGNVYNYTKSSNLGCLAAIAIGGLSYLAVVLFMGIIDYKYLERKVLRR